MRQTDAAPVRIGQNRIQFHAIAIGDYRLVLVEHTIVVVQKAVENFLSERIIQKHKPALVTEPPFRGIADEEVDLAGNGRLLMVHSSDLDKFRDKIEAGNTGKGHVFSHIECHDALAAPGIDKMEPAWV